MPQILAGEQSLQANAATRTGSRREIDRSAVVDITEDFSMDFAYDSQPLSVVELINQIEQAIRAKTGSRIQALQIEIADRLIIVSGRTSTYYNKQLATQAIRETADQMLVQNEVEVGG
jgi:hypothetical protein